jgi:hypothetical protein
LASARCSSLRDSRGEPTGSSHPAETPNCRCPGPTCYPAGIEATRHGKQTPREFKTIRLNLARSREFPEGSDRHGYTLVAPLDADGRLDPVAWRKNRELCRVVRFWGDDEEDVGHLVHRPGGSWGFTYDVKGDEDPESGFKLQDHLFRLGEYVSIRDDDDKLHTFRVVEVEDL